MMDCLEKLYVQGNMGNHQNDYENNKRREIIGRTVKKEKKRSASISKNK